MSPGTRGPPLGAAGRLATKQPVGHPPSSHRSQILRWAQHQDKTHLVESAQRTAQSAQRPAFSLQLPKNPRNTRCRIPPCW